MEIELLTIDEVADPSKPASDANSSDGKTGRDSGAGRCGTDQVSSA